MRGAATLSDELDVDPGYELAVAAALDGRCDPRWCRHRRGGRAARPRRRRRRPRAHRQRGAGCRRPGVHTRPPLPGRSRSSTTSAVRAAPSRGPRPAPRFWLVDSLSGVSAADFRRVAVTPPGRVYPSRTSEVRQSPALGEERILAERNRRELLLKDTESAANGRRKRARTRAAGRRAGVARGRAGRGAGAGESCDPRLRRSLRGGAKGGRDDRAAPECAGRLPRPGHAPEVTAELAAEQARARPCASLTGRSARPRFTAGAGPWQRIVGSRRN